MKAYCLQKFEAIVYSQSRVIAARCAKAFSELPLDWVMPLEPCLASDYLLRQRFDFVLIDLDSPEGSSLLDSLISSRTLHGAVLAITSKPVDAATLARCYKLQVFYPTRPEEIIDELYRALPLAERLSAAYSRLASTEIDKGLARSPQREPASTQSGLRHVAAFLSQVKRKPLKWLNTLLGMNHSLSVSAHERLACAIASVGAIWFVQTLTQDFRGMVCMGPPPPGPTETIAVSLLLWICAKNRRLSQNYLVTGERNGTSYLRAS